MSTLPPTTLANSPQLLLAAQVLRALEHHDLPMNARDYRDTVRWAREELAELDSSALTPLGWRLPATLRCVVENLLHERGLSAWSQDPVAQPEVLSAYASLMTRLRQGSR